MTERQQILESISTTVADYRAGEIARPTPEHVARWVEQFSSEVQVPLLRELDYVLKQTYFPRVWIMDFLRRLIRNRNLAGRAPRDFWRGARFLRIQQNGRSQVDLLACFDDCLQIECGFTTMQCGNDSGVFIYLDDLMFSGNRVGHDLGRWITQIAPTQAVVHVIVVAIHTSGKWLVDNHLKEVVAASGKKIEIKYWCAKRIENRKYYCARSEVLWPAVLPNDPDLSKYLALPHKYPFEPRAITRNRSFFSSEQGRQLLEKELTLAGVRIRGLCNNPKDMMRPLGYSPFGLGFGSTIVTYRNCPNNCPLALWWGNPKAAPHHPLSKWYPLFPRKTYVTEVDSHDLEY